MTLTLMQQRALSSATNSVAHATRKMARVEEKERAGRATRAALNEAQAAVDSAIRKESAAKDRIKAFIKGE